MSLPSTSFRAAGLAAVVAATALAGTASAAPVRIADGQLIDATSDGRYALIESDAGTQTVYDRSTQKQVPVGTGTALQLGSRGKVAGFPAPDVSASPRLLVQIGSDLYLRDLGTGTDQKANVDPAGKRVDWVSPHLVMNGKTVFFETTEATPRILRHDLDGNTTRERLSGAHLTDVSEDGQVVGWRLDGPTISRPAGSQPLPADAPGGVATHQVGYQLPGQPARTVAATTWTQKIENLAPVCSQSSISISRDDPTGLTVSTDPVGLATPGTDIVTSRYRLVLSHTVETGGSGVPGGYGIQSLLTQSGPGATIASSGQVFSSRATLDPVSGASSTITDSHFAFGIWNTAGVFRPDGTSRSLHVPEIDRAGTVYEPVALYSKIVPFDGGAGAVYDARPRDGADPAVPTTRGVYVDEFGPVGANTADWLTLPREVDGGVAPKVTYADCGPAAPVAGIATDYAPITLKTTGNSAGTVGVVLQPVGTNVPATSVSATVSWYGLRLWSRTAKTSAPITLPAIPAGIPGFKVTVKITLADGTVLNESAALRRTR